MKRLAGVVGLVFCMVATSGYSGINDGLVAHYPLDGNANDVSGNQNHGTAYGVSFVGGAQGGQAANFDGVNDYVRVPRSASLDIASNRLTLAAWVRWSGDTDGANYILDKHSNQYNLALNGGGSTSGKPRFIVGQSGILDSPVALTPMTWHFVAATYNGNVATIHIDGQEVASSNFQKTISPSGDLFIGCHQNCSDRYSFNGAIDEVRIYDRALSQSEIEELYDGGGNSGEPDLEYTFTVNNGQPVVSGDWVPVKITIRNTGDGSWDGGPVLANFFWVDEKDRGNDSYWNIIHGWFGRTYTERGHWMEDFILSPIPPGGQDSAITMRVNAFAAHFIDRAAVMMMDSRGNTLPGAREIEYNDGVDVRFNYTDASLNCAGTLITAITGGMASSGSSDAIKFMYEEASAGLALNSIAGHLNEGEYWDAGIEVITFITELGLNVNPVSGFAMTAFKEVSFLLPIAGSGPGGCGTLLAASGVEGYNFFRAAVAEENRLKAQAGLANLAQMAIALQGSGKLRIEDPEGRITVVDTSDLCTEGIPDSICLSMGELALVSLVGGADGYEVTADPDSSGTLLVKVLRLTTGGIFPMADGMKMTLDSEPTTDEFVWSVSVDGSDELSFTLDSSNQLMLAVDRGGDGTIDETLTPTVTVIDPTQGYAFSYWLDAAAHLPGLLGSQWRTDVVARNIGAETLKQDPEPFKRRASQPNIGWGFAEVEVLSGSGILASASVVDSVTNDATTIPFKR